MGAPPWLGALEPQAPDVVAVWRAIDGGPMRFRREVRRRAGPGTAPGVLAQQEAVADALAAALAACTDDDLRAPGGEEDWNVAHAKGHSYTGPGGGYSEVPARLPIPQIQDQPGHAQPNDSNDD